MFPLLFIVAWLNQQCSHLLDNPGVWSPNFPQAYGLMVYVALQNLGNLEVIHHLHFAVFACFNCLFSGRTSKQEGR